MKWMKWSFVLRNGAFFAPFCNFYSVFMISIISDCKNNIKYDFAVLESYFIYNGENIVPLLMLHQRRNGVLFYEMEHFLPLFATFILFLRFISYLTKQAILNMIFLY